MYFSVLAVVAAGMGDFGPGVPCHATLRLRGYLIPKIKKKKEYMSWNQEWKEHGGAEWGNLVGRPGENLLGRIPNVI